MNQNSKAKIALLAPFTIKGLSDALKKECQKIDLESEFFVAEYEKIYEEILSPESNLKKFEPNLTFLFLNKLTSKENIDSLINSFLGGMSGTLIVSTIPLATHSSIDIYDFKQGKDGHLWKKVVSEFNNWLYQKSGTEGGFSIYDFAGFFSKYGEYNVVDEKLRYLGDVFIRMDYLPKLAHELMGYVKARFSKNKKCIVLDLDNTLWGGVVGEEGLDGIKLDTKPPGNTFLEFQKYLFALNKRGIILAIASKNNYEDAIKVIREHPYMQLREDNFASIQINWDDKATQIKRIAEEINIGLDSIVFLDDDPVNRELVRVSLPQILVQDLPKDSELYFKTIIEMNDFDTLLITEEDVNRPQMYVAQRKANELKNQFSNMEEFLKSLEMKINIARANDFTIPRIAQLTQKTNQFNLTTKRYVENDIRNFVQNPNYEVYSVGVKDKFGEHGIVGAFIARHEGGKLAVDTFLLSCRVIGRNIEGAMVDFIKKLAKECGANEVVGEYIPTAKNAICKDVYKKCDFLEVNDNLFKFALV